MENWVSSLSEILGYDDDGSLTGGFYVLALLISFVGLSFGCALAILFLGADAWRAFKQKKHWIPGDSLLLGALSLQLLMLLNKPSGLDFSFNDKTSTNPLFYTCGYLNVIHGEWILILVGRVSTCVLMGCLLPGVATPLSTTLRTDMVALFISFALVSIHIISHEIFILPTASKIPGYVESTFYDPTNYDYRFHEGYNVFRCPPSHRWNSIFMELANVIVLLSMVSLALLLGCAALASIGIHEIVSRKIPLLLSPLKLSLHLYPREILWEKVEEQVLKSWIVVRTSNPQYIISRSVLSSSVALITTVCIVVLIGETARCSYKTKVFTSYDYDFFYLKTPQDLGRSAYPDYVKYYYEGCVRPSVSIPLILHYMVIFAGSVVIYYRCVTAAVFYPRGVRWKLWSLRSRYWQIEDFWVSHLLDLINGSKRHRWETAEESHLRKVIVRLLRSLRLYKLLPLIVWLQRLLVFFSKGCWLLLELLFSNNFFRKLLVGPASEALYNLYTANAQVETRLEGDPAACAKYKGACVTMQGESSAGLWIANKTSIEDLTKQFQKGEDEGNRCNELIALISDKCSAGFSGQRCVKPTHPLGFEVESELNVNQRSCKMTAVSIVILIFELSAFIHDEGETKNMVDRAMKSCCQAWNIIDVVEYSDSEEAALLTAADELLEKFNKERKWLDQRLPMSDSAEERSPEAAKAAVENMVERGKEVANAYKWRAWEEVAAACSMCRLCRRIKNENEFNTVEGVLDKLEGALADVIGSCIAKAGKVMAEDCKKWATNLEEERIWEAAKVVGKVKAITDKIGVLLDASPRSDIDQSTAGNGKHYFKRYEKFPTMTDFR